MTSQSKVNRRLFLGVCNKHGKRLYDTKKKAKRVAKTFHGENVDCYPCDYVDGMWHIGHIGPRVIRGEMSRDERFPRAS